MATWVNRDRGTWRRIGVYIQWDLRILGQQIFSINSEVFFIERYVYIMVKPAGTWE